MVGLMMDATNALEVSSSKVEVTDVHEEEKIRFIFWDELSASILKISAVELRKKMHMEKNRRSLKEFKGFAYPTDYVMEELGNKLIYDELNYDEDVLKFEFKRLFSTLTGIYHKIMYVVNGQNGGVFFLHGYGGTSKTFMWTTLAAALRSQGKIVLTVATSGIASLLLPGGRTAYSKFKIPVPLFENSTCNIDGNSDLAKLLKVTNLIIWDEAPMAHKFCFEASDRTLKDIMSDTVDGDKIFGGKVIVFGGDFRQILPVVPRADRSDIVHSSINSSYIWDECIVLTLTKNMRLRSNAGSSDADELKTFSEWILKVGEGKISEANDGIADFEIPDDLLIKEFDDLIDAIMKSTYPNFLNMYNNPDYLQQRPILASTIDAVDTINDYVLSIIPGEEKEYFSSDSIDRSKLTINASLFSYSLQNS
ncbi:PIF1-like helicase [Medicago truncatula]|uniref:ATP-dependent DNA helicase n=1 Tax=Medicago truncatula TaxID=3880 RepID=A0A072V9G8_MEDTR|nr:PIF1-like helicase [Medicago truncatula]